MRLSLRRLYAYAVLLLRDFFRLSPFDQLWELKAQVTMVLLQLFIAAAAVLWTSVAMGHLVILAHSKSAFSAFGGVLGVALYLANAQAEHRLIPRFEHEYRSLTRIQRMIGTVIVLLIVALAFAAAVTSAVAARGLR